MRLALSQLNCVVGDLRGNEERIAAGIAEARDRGAQLVLFPELAVTGYPPEDLLFKEHFLRDARAALDRLAARCTGIVAVIGFPERDDDVYNAAAVCADGRVQGVYRKMRLPNYGVFDELRYFQAGMEPTIVDVDGVPVGLTICEDVWMPGTPLSDEALAGARLVVNISASPYHAGKAMQRERMLAQRARDGLVAVAFCALVGGQDELVFDGASVVLDHRGDPIARAPQFAETLLVCDVDTDAPAAARLRDSRPRAAVRDVRPQIRRLPPVTSGAAARDEIERRRGEIAEPLDPVAEVYAALVLGTRDYVDKNGFRHVCLGLSGGVDSALVLLVAVDALGPERVSVAVMPSRYSSTGTQSDARTMAENLGVGLLELPIEGPMTAYEELLAEPFAGRDPDLTEENLQARIRGNLLMALSNKFGWLVLTTGNKSEMSVGYSTLYGDSAGGFAVIKDCPKTLVYALIDARVHRDPVSPVPEEIVTRAPSAELRPDQRDEDSLPPYEVLDPILEAYVEEDMGRDQLVARGYPAEDVERVIRLVDLAEYKRRQNPPGIKITPRSFGRDRRLPITNRYGGWRPVRPAGALPVPRVEVAHRDVDLPGRGLRVHVAEAGDPAAPPLVLLHGWPQHWWEWRKVLPALAEDFRVLCPDLRGLGWTSAPASGYDKEELATDLLALLDALELPRVALVGHDWGGWVGFLAVLRAPERFSGFLAVSIAHPFPKPSRSLLAAPLAAPHVPVIATPGLGASLIGSGRLVRRIFASSVGDREIWRPGEVDAYVERFTSDPDRVNASVQYYRRFLLHESPAIARGRYRARDLTVPTHVLMGERDTLNHASLWQRPQAGMTHELVPGVGHFLPEAAPDLLVERVRARLR